MKSFLVNFVQVFGLKNKSKLRAAALAALLFGLALLTGYKSLERSSKQFTYSISDWNSDQAKPQVLFHSNKDEWLEDLEVSFDFINKDTSYSYGNLLQTSSNSDGLRFELHPKEKLVLVVGSSHVIPISQAVPANISSRINLSYKRGDHLSVQVNDEDPIVVEDRSILDQKLRISNFVIGSGYGLQRSLYGEIHGFVSELRVIGFPLLSSLFKIFSLFFTFAGGLLVYSLFRQLDYGTAIMPKIGGQQVYLDRHLRPCVGYEKILYSFFSPSIVLILLGVFIVNFLINKTYFGVGKWIPFLAPFIIVVIALLLHLFEITYKSTNRVISVFSKATLYCYCLALTIFYLSGDHKSELIIFMMIFSIAIFLMGGRQAPVAAVGMVAWTSLTSLLTWELIGQQYDHRPFAVLIIGMSILVVYKTLIFSRIDWKGFGKGSVIIFVICIIAAIFISLRVDTLFIPGSEYHWEYYVGPIRSIRSGGWLLYDTPSQYGFLNIWLASLIPTNSSWQAFYLFQSALQFIVGALIAGVVAFSCFNTSQKIFALLGLFSALYFVDPNWLGPAPYPSSSVVRFIFCYLLLSFSIIFLRSKILEPLLAFTAICGILWSAESAVYSLTIYIFLCLGSVLIQEGWQKKISTAIKATALFLSFLVVGISLIEVIYLVRLGHSPDFWMHFYYALGYAGGHGYLPFDFFGPGNFLLILFLVIATVGMKVLQRPRNERIWLSPVLGAAGCIWVISSYYLGRPVPQNITAMIPVYLYCGFIVLGVVIFLRLDKLSALLGVVLSPLIILSATPFFSQTWWHKIGSYEAYSHDIKSRLRVASPELTDAIDELNSKMELPISYFGSSAAMPLFPKVETNSRDLAWLPEPLQLSMVLSRGGADPYINPVFLNRYLCNHRESDSVLIHQNGFENTAFIEFLKEIQRYYTIERTINNGGFSTYLFKIKSMAVCN